MTPLYARLLILVAIFVSVFLLSQLFLFFAANRRTEAHAINKRLELLRSGRDQSEIVDILRKNVPGHLRDDAGPFERITFRFDKMVRSSGIAVEPHMVLFYMAIGFVSITAIMMMIVWNSSFELNIGTFELVIGLSLAVSVGVPLLVLNRSAMKRRKKMEEQFPLALDIFTRALHAGHPIAAAVELLTKEVEDPLGSEFGLVADEVAYGAELNDALLSLAERWDLDDIRMFVITLSVQSETGGNLTEILENLMKVIRDRNSLYMKVRALSSEGRMSGWMLTVLPVLTFISVFIVSPQFYLNVAQDPMFIYGFTGLIVLYFIGVWIIRKMIDLEV
jgi:tight adherence protein B